MPLSVVILAAGQGKRMNSDLPKVLQPLGGAPLLEHVIATARRLAPDAVYVVFGHGGSQVQARLADAPVEWVAQHAQLGTGHAVMQALPLVPDDHTVLVLYGDVPLVTEDTLRRLLAAAETGAGPGAGGGAGALAVLTVEARDPTGYGRVVRAPGGAVRAIVEHRDASEAERAISEINTGLLAARAASLRAWLLGLRNDNSQGEFYLTDVVAAAVQSGYPVAAVPADDEADVLGVNDREQLALAEARLRRRRATDLMRAGATLVDPARIDVRGELTVGRDVVIDVNAVFEGRVVLGDRVRIGPNCVLRDTSVGDDTEIVGHCFLEESTIARRCRIGPFARLRPGAELHDDVHIGNFVEVKASRIGAGSKANHLTYIGDSRVGANVNVGAGSITCNYDGANKWPTVIEDGAFIGSGTMMVAPVRIGAGSTTGAGSTIAQNVPPGKLVLTRAPQVTVEGWRRPGKLDATARDAAIDAKLAGATAPSKPKDTPSRDD